MKMLVGVLILLGAANLAEAGKPRTSKKNLKQQTAAPQQQELKQEAAKADQLDLNTKAWLYQIRVQVYGYDAGRKNGKGGC